MSDRPRIAGRSLIALSEPAAASAATSARRSSIDHTISSRVPSKSARELQFSDAIDDPAAAVVPDGRAGGRSLDLRACGARDGRRPRAPSGSTGWRGRSARSRCRATSPSPGSRASLTPRRTRPSQTRRSQSDSRGRPGTRAASTRRKRRTHGRPGVLSRSARRYRVATVHSPLCSADSIADASASSVR